MPVHVSSAARAYLPFRWAHAGQGQGVARAHLACWKYKELLILQRPHLLWQVRRALKKGTSIHQNTSSSSKLSDCGVPRYPGCDILSETLQGRGWTLVAMLIKNAERLIRGTVSYSPQCHLPTACSRWSRGGLDRFPDARQLWRWQRTIFNTTCGWTRTPEGL
jgi:hypothetical protein